jgi:hypothetical protein
MFVADAGIALWIAGLLLVGMLGFFLVAVTMVCRFVAFIFRAVTGVSKAGKRRCVPRTASPRRMICPHLGCGHNNEPTALYCGRCGRPLRQTYDVDAYG